MKRKIRMKKWVMVVITLIIIIVGIEIYAYLSRNVAYASKNICGSMFICLGWFWLLVGQIMVLYAMWEK